MCRRALPAALIGSRARMLLKDPFMKLSFLCLPVIPELKLTDMGLVLVYGMIVQGSDPKGTRPECRPVVCAFV